MELAALSLKAESKSLTVATEELKDLSAAAKGAEAAADSLAGGSKRADSAVGKEGASARKAAGENKALGTEVRTAAGSLENMATGAGRASGSLDRMAAMIVRGTVGLVGMAAAAMSVGAYKNMADTWSDMQSVVGAAIKDMESAPPLMSEIVRLANASYSPLEQTARGFAMNATTLRELGKTQQEMLDYTEAVNNALVINAARGENAAVVQNALNRALATGKLQATEYEVIMSRSPRILEAVAQEMGTTVASLRQLGSEGKVTGDIITRALIGSLEELRTEAAKMPAIVEDAFTRIQTNTLALVGSFDQAFAVSERFAGAVLALADGIGALAQIDFASWGEGTVKILTTLGQVALVLAATRIPALIVATKAMTVSFVAGVASINGVSVALVASAVATRASAVAMGVGAAAARGLATALAFVGGPLGLIAAGVAALGVVLVSTSISARNAAEEMRSFDASLSAVADGARLTETQISKLSQTQVIASLERQRESVRGLAKDLFDSAYALADVQANWGSTYLAEMLGTLTSQFEQGNISISHYREGLDALGRAVPSASEPLISLIQTLDNVVEGTEGVMRGEAILRVLQGTATAADRAMLGLAESTQAAADATSNLTIEQQKAIDTAQQMADEYANRSALAQIEVQYGKDSAQYMAEQLSQQRALTFARIDALDIAERDRQALRDSYDQMIANEAAAQGWAVSVGNVNIPLSASYDWLVKIRDTQPDGTWLGTAIQRAATLATNLWDAATASRSLSVEPAPGQDTGSLFWWSGQTLSSIMPPVIGFKKEVENAGNAASDAAKEVERLKDAADGIKDSIDPMRAYNRQLADMQKMVDSGFLSKDEMAKGIRELNVELVDSLPLVGDLTDALVGGLFDGFKNGLDGILDVFKNWLKQMVLEAAKNQIVLSMGATTGAVGSAVGSAASAASGGLIGGVTSGIGALMGGVSTGISSFMTTGLSSLGTALSGATAGMAGLGAAIGAVAVPVLAVVAAISFFKKKTTELDAGVRLTVNAVDTMVETFNKTETSRFWGLSKKTRTSYQQAADELANPIIAAVAQIQSSIVDAASSLGVGADAFDGFTKQLVISTKGMSAEDASQAVQDALSGLGDDFALMIDGLEELIGVNETATEALSRLANSLALVNDAFDLFGTALLDQSLVAANLASVMVEAAGGMDAFTAAANVVFTKFYSEAYQLETNTRRLTETMAALGLTMPQSRDQFLALLEGIDRSTEAGAALYGQVLSLAAAFDAVLPSANAMTIEMQKLHDALSTSLTTAISAVAAAAREAASAADGWGRVSDNITTWLSNQRGTASALTSPLAARAANESQYQITLARAMAGDVEAAGNITGAADALIASVNDTARNRVEAMLAEARVVAGVASVGTIADIEQTRHNQIAALLEAEVTALTDIRALIAGGEVLTADQVAYWMERAANAIAGTTTTTTTGSNAMVYQGAQATGSASTVYATPETRVVFDQSALLAEVKALKEELTAMRSESRSLGMAVADNTRKTTNRLDTALREGMPVTGVDGGPVITKEAV